MNKINEKEKGTTARAVTRRMEKQQKSQYKDLEQMSDDDA